MHSPIQRWMILEKKFWNFKEIILDNIEDKSNLVDTGCGWGSTLLQLNGKIEKLVGIDESSHRAKT